MRRITVPVADRSYPILIGSGLLDQLGELARETGIGESVALVEDASVSALYGDRVARSLEAAGFRVTRISVPSGEESKCLAQLGALYDAFAEARLDRRSAVVALGGGVVGDLAGFAAATYLRGIDLVQVPTTLLAQVDSSVGGKTGIDLNAAKNLVGAFHQPSLVVIDPTTLRSLPEREFRAGLAEVVKYGVIADPDFFTYLEANGEAILRQDPEALVQIIGRSCEIKAEVVGQDEREAGLRAILNYGHTIGHAVEAVAGYGRYSHGECVAIGMVAAGRLARERGWLAEASANRIIRLLDGLALPTRMREPLPEAELLRAMWLDKKVRGNELRFVLAREIGRVEVTSVAETELAPAMAAIRPD